MNNSLINLLNFLRWSSALLVVLGHLRAFLYVSYFQQDNHSIFNKIFYFITGFGHQAVMVFFVISGFLVGGKVLEKTIQKSITRTFIIDYCIKRFTRIYIVLIPALILGYLFDSIGSVYYPELYTNIFHISSMNFNVLDQLNIKYLIGNFFNLQTIFVPTLGSNGPLWSLSNEWAYYIIFILFFINSFTLFIGLFLIGMIFIFNQDIIIYFIIWLFGSVTFLINKKLLNKYISALLFIGVLLISRKISGFHIDILLGVFLCLLLNSILNKKETADFVLFKKLNHLLADFSYSLYLTHFPFIVLIISILHSLDINILLMNSTLDSFLIYTCFLLAIYLYVYIMYLLFEKQTEKFKMLLQKLFKIGKAY